MFCDPGRCTLLSRLSLEPLRDQVGGVCVRFRTLLFVELVLRFRSPEDGLRSGPENSSVVRPALYGENEVTKE